MPSTEAEQHVDEPETISHGTLTVNLRGFSVTVGDRDIALTRAEFLLLVALARDPYNVLGRETLSTMLREAHLGRGGEQPTLRAVDVHIARLRRKLGRVGYASIKTMRNVGYRFVPTPTRDNRLACMPSLGRRTGGSEGKHLPAMRNEAVEPAAD